VLAQEPAVAKLIISFNQFHPISLGKAQLIGTSGMEVVWKERLRSAVVVQVYQP
jgi:hypothetical protein